MSNPTTPFGWQMPEPTDLVTDLPADFEVFGQAVATSMQDLLGGTTGQVLAKASNADMDFVWSADAAGMTNPMTTTGDVIYSSPGSTPVRLGIGSTGEGLAVVAGIPAWTPSATSTLTTTGDMLYASAANTLANRAVGTTGQVLTVAGGVPTWATPASSSPASASATVATLQTTTSTSYTDLSTAGPAVTITTGTKALVLINATCYKQGSGSNAFVGFAVSGATTLAASDTTAMNWVNQAYYDNRFSVSTRVTGLTAGSNTFTLKYRSNGGGTAEYFNREIIVIDLGS
jgi:hypothetical protein